VKIVSEVLTGKVIFKSIYGKFKLREQLIYKSFFPLIFIEEGFSFEEVSFIFCDDDYLKKLNVEFLKHDTFTDILTFTLSDHGRAIVSEIYISIDRVKENAEFFGVLFPSELDRVMIHGLLHLCGYEDHTTELKALMRNKEDYFLEKLSYNFI
jgi:rRNA maturation RNase YbeY